MTEIPGRGTALDAVRAGVRKIKGGSLTDADISEDTSLWPLANSDLLSLGFDSLDLLELVVFLEEEYGWRVSEDDIDAEELRTVGDLVSLAGRNEAEPEGSA